MLWGVTSNKWIANKARKTSAERTMIGTKTLHTIITTWVYYTAHWLTLIVVAKLVIVTVRVHSTFIVWISRKWCCCSRSDSGMRWIVSNGRKGCGGGSQFTVIAVAYVARNALALWHMKGDCALSHGGTRISNTTWVDALSLSTSLVLRAFCIIHTIWSDCAGQRDAGNMWVALEAWWTLADRTMMDDGALGLSGTRVGGSARVHTPPVDACVNGGAM